MKRSMLLWGVLLIVVGFLLFRFGITSLYPEVIESARATGDPGHAWSTFTTAQKVVVIAMEIPFFAGIVLAFAGLVQLAKRKRSPQMK